MTNDNNRDELREKIEAGERRNQERSLADSAREASELATEFVKAHPIATVAGVALVGIAIGAMTRPGRRLGHRAAGLANYATEAGIAYALGIMESAEDLARSGADSLEDFGDTLGSSARKAKREANYFAASTRDAARDFGRRAGRKAGRAYRDSKAKIAS